MQKATVLFLIDRKKNKILLGLKKRGFATGKWNGVGGKVNPDETIEAAAIRETFEEINVTVELKNIKEMAIFNFNFIKTPDWAQEVHIFTTEIWSGEPVETEEIRPQWFDLNLIPYNQMWKDDRYWLPEILACRKVIGDFLFADDDKIEHYSMIDL